MNEKRNQHSNGAMPALTVNTNHTIFFSTNCLINVREYTGLDIVEFDRTIDITF